MKLNHIFTSDQKLEWWSHGEWVEEPDEATFWSHGYRCHVLRIVHATNEALESTPASPPHGGYLCGYVLIPKEHPWHGKGYDDMPCNVHGRITYAEFNDKQEFWIGFDCAHAYDLNPSTPAFRAWHEAYNPAMKDHYERMDYLRAQFENEDLLNPPYRNFTYAMGQCRKIARQAKAALKSKVTP